MSKSLLSQFAAEDMAGGFQVFDELEFPDTDDGTDMIHIDIGELDKLMDAYGESCLVHNQIVASLENAVGLDVFAVRMAEISLSSISNRVGIYADKTTISIESFGTKATRLTATRLALESIKDRIVEVVNKIIAMIMVVWNKIKAFIDSIFNNKDHLKVSIKKLLPEIDNVDDSKHVPGGLRSVSKEDSNHGTEMQRRIPFGIKGKCDYETAKIVTLTTTHLVESHRVILGNILKCIYNIASGKHGDEVVDNVDKIVEEIKNELEKLKLHGKKINGNKVEYIYGYLIAGKLCELEETVGKQEAHELRRVFNIELSITQADYTYPFVPDLLKKNEMSDLATMSIHLLDEAKELDVLIKTANNVLGKFESHFKNNRQHLSEETMQTTVYVVRDLFKYVTTNVPKMSLDSNRVAISIGHYVRDCVNAYKGVVDA